MGYYASPATSASILTETELNYQVFSSFKLKFSGEYLTAPSYFFTPTHATGGWPNCGFLSTPDLINRVLSSTLGLLISLRWDHGQASSVEVSCTALQRKLGMSNLQGKFCNSCSIPSPPSCSRCTHRCPQTAPSERH